jgi:hypothetical protein
MFAKVHASPMSEYAIKTPMRRTWCGRPAAAANGPQRPKEHASFDHLDGYRCVGPVRSIIYHASTPGERAIFTERDGNAAIGREPRFSPPVFVLLYFYGSRHSKSGQRQPAKYLAEVLPHSAYSVFLRHLETHTTWYLHYHFIWLRLSYLSIDGTSLRVLGGSRFGVSSVDSLKRQTFAATQAEPAGLPCELVFWIQATAGTPQMTGQRLN